MNDREKKLAAIVAAIVVLWGASQGWGKYTSALQRNRNTQTNVAQQLSEARTAKLRGERAQRRLRQWSKQSLPQDPEIAKSLYQDWLQEQLVAAGLKVEQLDARDARSGTTYYEEFNFIVRASGTLSQFADFLHRFYSANHLHRISKSTLTPTEDRRQLNLSFTVDALSLDSADRSEKLAEGKNNELQQPAEQFLTSIDQRNMFATYQPFQPRGSRFGEGRGDSEAAQARVSGIHYGQDGWLLVVSMQDSGRVYTFREGERIRIGRFRGMVEKLDGERRQAIVTTRDARMVLQLGGTLAEAQPLGDNEGS